MSDAAARAVAEPLPSWRGRALLVAELACFVEAWRLADRLGPWVNRASVSGWQHLRHYAVVVPLLALLIAGLQRLRGQRLDDLGLRWPGARRLALGVLAGVALFGVLTLAFNALRALGLEANEFPFRTEERTSLLLLVASGVLAGGFFEELVYRGYLFARLHLLFGCRARPWLGGLAALLCTSAWFAVNHLYQGPLGAANAGLAGLALCGLMRLFRGELVPVMAAHATVDTLGLLLPALT